MADMTINGAYIGKVALYLNKRDRPKVRVAGQGARYVCEIECSPETVVTDPQSGDKVPIQRKSVYKRFVGTDGNDYKDRMWTDEEIAEAFPQAYVDLGRDVKGDLGFSRPVKKTVVIQIT